MSAFNILHQTLHAVVPISTTDAQVFFDRLTPQRLKSDDYFVTEGQVCDKIGFVVKGMVRAFYLDEKSETTRWVSLEGEFFTSLGSFITGAPSNHYLRATF